MVVITYLFVADAAYQSESLGVVDRFVCNVDKLLQIFLRVMQVPALYQDIN